MSASPPSVCPCSSSSDHRRRKPPHRDHCRDPCRDPCKDCITWQPIMPGDPRPGHCGCKPDRCRCPRPCPPPPCEVRPYFTGRLQAPVTLVAAANTTLTFNLIVALYPDTAYNGVTGAFTVPWGGAGFYSLTSHLSLTGEATTAANVTASIMVNGVVAISGSVLVPAAGTSDLQLAIGFPVGQLAALVVMVQSDVSGVVVDTRSSNFSLVRVAA